MFLRVRVLIRGRKMVFNPILPAKEGKTIEPAFSLLNSDLLGLCSLPCESACSFSMWIFSPLCTRVPNSRSQAFSPSFF